jgi:hypothetical protein
MVGASLFLRRGFITGWLGNDVNLFITLYALHEKGIAAILLWRMPLWAIKKSKMADFIAKFSDVSTG